MPSDRIRWTEKYTISSKYPNRTQTTQTVVRKISYKDIISCLLVVFVTVQFVIVGLLIVAQYAQPTIKRANTHCEGKIGIATQNQWMYLCKLYFYEYLELSLNITMSDAKTIKEPLNDFYTYRKFSDKRHLKLLSAIDS